MFITCSDDLKISVLFCDPRLDSGSDTSSSGRTGHPEVHMNAGPSDPNEKRESLWRRGSRLSRLDSACLRQNDAHDGSILLPFSYFRTIFTSRGSVWDDRMALPSSSSGFARRDHFPKIGSTFGSVAKVSTKSQSQQQWAHCFNWFCFVVN